MSEISTTDFIFMLKTYEGRERKYYAGNMYPVPSATARRLVAREIASYVIPKEILAKSVRKPIYKFMSISDRVSIIIPVKDALDYLKRCLTSLKKYTNNYELIIIDNGSNKETKEFFDNIDWLDFKLITNQKNMGYSYACNQGVKITKYKYICFLNDDTILTPNWLYQLIKCFKINQDCGIASPTTSWSGGEQCDRSLMPKRFDMTMQDILQYANQLTEDYKVSDISGFCMLTKKTILDRIGIFDYKRYGLFNTEEKDLMWRMNRIGYRHYWVKGSYVHHYGHITIKEMGSDPFDNLAQNRATLEKRKTSPILYVVNDTVVKHIKYIEAKRTIDVIIPILDRKEETINTLNSLFLNNEDINVIIVDNGSKDLSYLDKFDVNIIRNKDNRGVICALNQGFDVARSNYVVFMHNDIVVNTRNWIDKAVKYMEKNEDVGMVGVAGWNLLNTEAIYRQNNLKTAIDKYDRKPNGDFEEVVVLDGCCNVIKNIGLKFDDIYGLIHFHDLDLCMQYREKGYKIYVMNGSVIHFAEDRPTSTITHSKYLDKLKGKRDFVYWDERRKLFLDKWSNLLPISIAPIPILMITWNRLEYTKKAIRFIRENTYHPYILWIWDNGSTDGTVKYLKSLKDKNVIIHFKDKNYGLVPPMNAFFNEFKYSQYVAKVDNDTIVAPFWLTRLKDVMEDIPLFVIQADHYLGLPYRLKNNQQFYNELESIDYKGEKLYLFPHGGGSGILIRRKHIDRPIEVIEGKLSGWVDYQFNKCKTENLRCAFYTGVWVDRLDFVGTNKIKIDYPEYNKEINKMRSDNKNRTGFGFADIDLENLKICREIMKIRWR